MYKLLDISLSKEMQEYLDYIQWAKKLLEEALKEMMIKNETNDN